MSRRGRDPKRPQDAPKKKEPEFRGTGLADALGKWKVEQKKAEPPPPPKPAKAPPPPPPPPKKSRGENDLAAGDDLFLRSMGEVEPVRRGRNEPGAPTPIRRSPEIVNEEAETLARLAELVATGEGLDLADTDEYVEGSARGVDPTLLETLRRGDFSVQAHVDLHGLGRDQARERLESFLVESRRKGLRCVLVVHGRGLHSKDQIPVLKEQMRAWLSRGRLSKLILAFATARPIDGGAGAMYLLLRR